MAVVGDAHLDWLALVLGASRGLIPKMLDVLRQQLWRGEMLGFPEGRALAEKREADIGRSIMQRWKILLPMMLQPVQEFPVPNPLALATGNGMYLQPLGHVIEENTMRLVNDQQQVFENHRLAQIQAEEQRQLEIQRQSEQLVRDYLMGTIGAPGIGIIGAPAGHVSNPGQQQSQVVPREDNSSWHVVRRGQNGRVRARGQEELVVEAAAQLSAEQRNKIKKLDKKIKECWAIEERVRAGASMDALQLQKLACRKSFEGELESILRSSMSGF